MLGHRQRAAECGELKKGDHGACHSGGELCIQDRKSKLSTPASTPCACFARDSLKRDESGLGCPEWIQLSAEGFEVGNQRVNACQVTIRVFSGHPECDLYFPALGHGIVVEVERTWFLRVSRAVSYGGSSSLQCMVLISKLLRSHCLSGIPALLLISSSAEHSNGQANAFCFVFFFLNVLFTYFSCAFTVDAACRDGVSNRPEWPRTS